MSRNENRRLTPRQVAAQLLNRYFDHDVPRDSAALTYYLLFAIFPLLVFVSTLLGRWPRGIWNMYPLIQAGGCCGSV